MNRILFVVLGAAILLAFFLASGLLTPQGPASLSALQWSVLGVTGVALALAVFLPGSLRRKTGASGRASSRSDLHFALALTLVLCPLAFFAVWAFGALGTFVIGLAPIACIVRSPRLRQAAD